MAVTHLAGKNGRTICGAVLSERHKNRIVKKNPGCHACANGGKAPQAHLSLDTEPDWAGVCEVCGASPTMPETGMCGPCSTGEADTVGGNW